jgi:hypothetical protein
LTRASVFIPFVSRRTPTERPQGLAHLAVDGYVEAGIVAVDASYLARQGKRGGAAHVEAGAEAHMPSLEGGAQDVVVGIVGIAAVADGGERGGVAAFGGEYTVSGRRRGILGGRVCGGVGGAGGEGHGGEKKEGEYLFHVEGC